MILACKCPEQFMGTFWSTFTKVILFLGIDFSEKVCVDIVTSNSLHLCFFTFLFRCRNLTFPDRLPEVSIVFIFVNEALSVILRSIHSAIDRTPAHLLKEIILVDDNSNNGKRFLVFFFFFLICFPPTGDGSYMRILEFWLLFMPLAFQMFSAYFFPFSYHSLAGLCLQIYTSW